MNKKMCKELLEMSGDRCSCGGIHEIICDRWMDGKNYYYLKCNKCGEIFE